MNRVADSEPKIKREPTALCGPECIVGTVDLEWAVKLVGTDSMMWTERHVGADTVERAVTLE